jgi:RNA polymerase sigma-70 factor (ECF subfamily)
MSTIPLTARTRRAPRPGIFATIAILLLGTACTALAGGQKAAKNLVTNPGAEAGTGATPDGWSQAVFPASMSVDGQVEYIWHDSEAHGGQRSLCFKKTAPRYFPVAQWSQKVAWDGGAAGKLAVSCWIKSRDATKATLTVQFNGEDGAQIGREFAAYVGAKNDGGGPVTQDWKEYKATVAVPAGTKQITVAPEMYGPGVVWFDDITVSKTE